MDFLWILVAFAGGFLMKQIGMPPLVGFLLAGFGLHAAGVEPAANLQTLADLGITLMLFTIGLKLDVRALIRPEVWATTTFNTGLWTLLMIGLLALASWLGISHYYDVSWTTQALIGFALSFSSTVCVVKMLEESSELKAKHGRLALGILIIQDIFAVLFLVASTGKVPSIWALALLLLWFARPLLYRLVQAAGHGELLPLLGFFLALGGSELFYAVDLKGDLGALVVGMLLARHPKGSELYKALMGFKDLFLIGFFLSIGFTALPSADMAVSAAMLLLILVVKFALFFWLLTRFKVSGRSSYLAALALTNYSEFGLIVAHLSVKNGWMSEDWLVIIALVMSVSFILSSFLYRRAHHIYALHKDTFNRFERSGVAPKFERPANAEILILGMGRVGKGAYQAITPDYPEQVWGIESDSERVARLRQEGICVALGDSDDLEFWQQALKPGANGRAVQLVMLALPSQVEMLSTLEMLRLAGYQGRTAAVARYEDERQQLLELGVDVVFNYYAEVGAGFAAETRPLLQSEA
jgi:predicted Kef-type K+ transport protein